MTAENDEGEKPQSADKPDEKTKAERRRYKRMRVELTGRLFVPSENREAHCKIADMSPGGARIVCDAVPPQSTPVVVYIDGFGRFEGIVARPDEASFGVEFTCSAHKRERVAEQLTHYMNGGSLDEAALRRHERKTTKGIASFTRANGDVVKCEVLDLSLSGVSLATHIRPPVGEFVLIGQMAGRVARHHETGIGIEFTVHDRLVAEPPRPKLFVAR
jgi:hypothetical protein